jgi:hypothetical protein
LESRCVDARDQRAHRSTVKPVRCCREPLQASRYNDLCWTMAGKY